MCLTRRAFKSGGLTLSYLDTGGDGPALVALHSHFLEGATYAPLANSLVPDWRVIALDQRGHGYSDHAPTYSRQDYLDDLKTLLDHLEIRRAVLLGNSLGGANAYQFASAWPECVSAMIIEDIGVVITDDITFCLAWSGMFKTYEELAKKIGPRFLPYLKESIRQGESGWHLAFEPEDMVRSQRELNGDHWHDWLASSCPALVIRGSESRVSDPIHLQEMVKRRPHSQLKIVPGGHNVHVDSPAEFLAAVREFLTGLQSGN